MQSCKSTSERLHVAYVEMILPYLQEYEPILLGNIEQMRSHVRGSIAQGWLDEWGNLILNRDLEELKSICLGDDEHSHDMRQVSPFYGIISTEQRNRVLA